MQANSNLFHVSELKETISRVGADLKQRLVDSIRSTWNTVYQLTAFGRADDGLEQEVDKVIEKIKTGSENVAACLAEQDQEQCDVGCLNQGRRIDYVLQEAPLESFNEYVSAIRSHLIYWYVPVVFTPATNALIRSYLQGFRRHHTDDSEGNIQRGGNSSRQRRCL